MALLVMVASMGLGGCMGQMGLSGMVTKGNLSVVDNRYARAGVFMLLSPVYGLAATADLFVFNTIEFWSGSNPVAQRVGKTIEVQGQDGRYYAVTTLKDGYSIKKPTGEVIKFIYDKDTKTWQEEENGIVTDLFRFNDDGTVQAFLPNGTDIKVSQDEAGLFQTRMAMNGACFYAAR